MGELISKDAFQVANELGKQELAQGPRALSARYEAGEVARIVVELDNGCAFAFPVDQAQGLAGAKADDLAIIEVTPTGLGLHWPKIDADLSVPAMLGGVLGSRQWMAQLGQIGGRSRSDRKADAARANGKRGGRPPTLETGGTVHHIKGSSGKIYSSVEISKTSVSSFEGILIIEQKALSAKPSIIDAADVDDSVAEFDGVSGIERILCIRERDAVKRRKAVLDLEAQLTVIS